MTGEFARGLIFSLRCPLPGDSCCVAWSPSLTQKPPNADTGVSAKPSLGIRQGRVTGLQSFKLELMSVSCWTDAWLGFFCPWIDYSPLCSGLGDDPVVPSDATKAAKGQVLSLETSCELIHGVWLMCFLNAFMSCHTGCGFCVTFGVLRTFISLTDPLIIAFSFIIKPWNSAWCSLCGINPCLAYSACALASG